MTMQAGSFGHPATKVGGRDIGVCSWSLQPQDMADLVSAVRQTGLDRIQLDLSMLLDPEGGVNEHAIALFRESELKLTGTMIGFAGEDYSTLAMIRRTGGLVPDEHWPARRELALRAGRLTARLGAADMSLHFGFIPSPNDPLYSTIVDRVRELAQELSADSVNLLAETGQETASDLLRFLNDLNCRNVGVNFDAANMIMYGVGDPFDAISILGRHIMHVHVKDAVASSQPGIVWGREVPLGAGDVSPAALLDALDEIGYTGPLVIERETGANRVADIQAAVRTLREADETDE